jgi:hypothetical protein
VVFCKLGFGESGEVEHLQNVKKNCALSKSWKCESTGHSMNYSPHCCGVRGREREEKFGIL